MKKIQTILLFLFIISCASGVNKGITPFFKSITKNELQKKIIYNGVDVSNYEPTKKVYVNRSESLTDYRLVVNQIREKYKQFASIQVIYSNEIYWNYEPIFTEIAKEIGADYLFYIVEGNICYRKYQEEIFNGFCEVNRNKIVYVAIFFVEKGRLSIKEQSDLKISNNNLNN